LPKQASVDIIGVFAIPASDCNIFSIAYNNYHKNKKGGLIWSILGRKN